MKSPDEVPVHHLVSDSGAFILRASLVDLGSIIYTVQDVIDEIRDKETRERMQFLPFELVIRKPSSESLKIVTEASKKTGDYASLSVTDLKVIALTHDLHVEHCGRETINYNVKSVVETIDDRVKSKEILNKIPPGFHQTKKQTADEDVEDNDDADSSDEDDEEDWIGEGNFEEAVQKIEDHSTPLKDKMVVACLSTDFAVQNVLLHMKMDIISINGMQVKTLRTYILRCRCCYKTTPVMTKQFCPKCGNKALHRVAVTVDEDGVMQLHIDWERLRVTRGLKHSVKMPKGGKHDDFEQIVEDQRMPQNRMARLHQDAVSDSPFSTNDVTSRSALIGIRSFGHRGQRNPNVQAKKRTGKKKK